MNANGSKRLYRINAHVFKESLGLPASFSQNPDPFIEDGLVRFYKDCILEEKDNLFSKILKPVQSIVGISFSFDDSMCEEYVQSLLSLLGQFLGHENDTFVVEIMLRFLLKIIQSNSSHFTLTLINS